MTETAFTREERSNRDMILAGIMLLAAVGVFWHLDNVFHVSAYFWYPLLYLGILSPFVGLMLHTRPFILKLSFLVVMATAVFLS